MDQHATAKLLLKTVFFIAIVLAVLLLIDQDCDMKIVSLVELPDAKKPAFLDSCVVCGKPEGEKLELALISDEHSRVEFYLYGLDIKPGQGTLLQVPMHDSCAKGVRNDLLKHLFLILVVAVAIAVFGIVQQYNTLLSVSLAVIVATPLLYFQFTKPVPFEFYHYDKRFFLLFKDRNYAKQVVRLNGVEAKECENPFLGSRLKTGH